MTTAQANRATSKTFRIDRKLLVQIWRLTRPYWLRSRAWRAWVLLGAIGLLIALGAGAMAWSSYRMKDMTDGITGGQWSLFVESAILFAVLQLLAGLVAQPLIQIAVAWISQDWRGWLTRFLTDAYLSDRAYYDIAQKHDLDNPDQRLQESATLLTTALLSFPIALMNQATTIAASVGVIAALDSRLAVYALGIALVQVLVKYFAMTPAIRLNYQVMVAEADLRYSLVHVREHAEPIAFYRGEDAERQTIFHRLTDAVKRQLHVKYYEVVLSYVIPRIFNLAWLMLPYLVLGPRVVSGELTFGTITQATIVTAQIMMSVMLVSSLLPLLGQAAPHAMRLAEIEERLGAIRREAAHPTVPRIASHSIANGLTVKDVSLVTPDGRSDLVDKLTLSIGEGDRIAIVGETGVGKSSLLRAMAGLWNRGTGTISRPDPAECLFLPQRPYMALESLGAQLSYPSRDTVDEKCMREALDAVRLPTLADRFGGFDAVADWGRTLSLGEQQRLAFARILINKPRYIFLDEATSAVDNMTETHLYDLLCTTGATFVSVGHRQTILRYHTRLLTLLPGGGWLLEPIESN